MFSYNGVSIFQAWHGRLIPVQDGSGGVTLVGYNAASPKSCSIFDPDTLASSAHIFNDSLQIDYATNSPVLDSDGVTYNGARSRENRSFRPRDVSE